MTLATACLHFHAERVLRHPLGPTRLIVNIADVLPQFDEPQTPHLYAFVIEQWFHHAGDYSAVREDLGSWWSTGEAPASRNSIQRHAYLVSERIQLDVAQRGLPGRRSPGVKAIYLTRRPPGLSSEEAAKGWREHADTARTHHIGMTKYVQNGVREGITADAPVIHGFAELHFCSIEDLEQRMYDSEAGKAAIKEEASRLVGQVTPLFTSEYIIRG